MVRSVERIRFSTLNLFSYGFSFKKIIRDAFYKEKQLQEKSSFADIVTETDTSVEKCLIEALKSKYPNHSFIGEESTINKVNFTNDPVWIIDPVDGTTNFVHKFPYCAISIAFYVNKEVVILFYFLRNMPTFYYQYYC